MAELLDVGLESPGRVERVVFVVGVFADACEVERGWCRVGGDTGTVEGLSEEQQQKHVEGERDEDQPRRSAESPRVDKGWRWGISSEARNDGRAGCESSANVQCEEEQRRSVGEGRGSERRKKQAKQVVSLACALPIVFPDAQPATTGSFIDRNTGQLLLARASMAERQAARSAPD